MVLPAAANTGVNCRATTPTLDAPETWRSTKVSDNFDAMIEALKQTGKRLRQALEEMRRRLFGSGGADDPYAAVRVPRNRNPPGRAGAVALEEPEGDVRVEAIGRRPA